jgi:hypothetical protein
MSACKKASPLVLIVIKVFPMSRSKQPYLHDALRPRAEHGGSIRQGRRKLARPVDPKRPLHVVLRSEKAKGDLSLLRGKTLPLFRRYFRGSVGAIA